jgi:hypothetical protein
MISHEETFFRISVLPTAVGPKRQMTFVESLPLEAILHLVRQNLLDCQRHDLAAALIQVIVTGKVDLNGAFDGGACQLVHVPLILDEQI